MKRREAIHVILAGCCLPALASRTAFAKERLCTSINPPAEPMRFSRQLRRELDDGEAIVVSRSFLVQFGRTENGFELAGTQNQVTVDLPERLAGFAELERARDESGIFPIGLNGDGEIISGFTPQALSNQVEDAITHALQTIEQQGLDGEEHSRLRAFAMAVHNSGGAITAHMPVDLFAPAQGPQEHTQRLDMGGGIAGEVRATFVGESNVETGLMRSATRDITTVVENDLRSTREEWSLTMA